MKRERFKQAYEDHYKLVLHVAFDVLQDYDLAQEVCAEVFVEFYGKMRRLRERHIKGWLLECAWKKAIRYLEEFTEKEDQGLLVECQVELKDRK